MRKTGIDITLVWIVAVGKLLNFIVPYFAIRVYKNQRNRREVINPQVPLLKPVRSETSINCEALAGNIG